MEKATAPNVRLTISVTPEVHAAFVDLAEASNLSISRCMGEWLGDTLDAVKFTAQKVQQARAAPKIVMREMHAYALGLRMRPALSLIGCGRVARRASASAARRPASFSPRLVIRGGKSPNEGQR